MPKLIFTSALVASTILTGCLSIPGGLRTSAALSEGNFKIIQRGARGEDRGFWLLGIPIDIPTARDAKRDLDERLVKHFGEQFVGDRVTLANETNDFELINFILVQIPRVVVTADVVRFDKKETSACSIPAPRSEP